MDRACPGGALYEAAEFQRQDHLVNRGRRGPKILQQVGFGGPKCPAAARARCARETRPRRSYRRRSLSKSIPGRRSQSGWASSGQRKDSRAIPWPRGSSWQSLRRRTLYRRAAPRVSAPQERACAQRSSNRVFGLLTACGHPARSAYRRPPRFRSRLRDPLRR